MSPELHLFVLVVFGGYFQLPVAQTEEVQVYYYLKSPTWGDPESGVQNCGSNGNLTCTWYTSSPAVRLRDHLQKHSLNASKTQITVAVYNIHSFERETRKRTPIHCDLPVDLTLVTTMEPFYVESGGYDGNCSTNPSTAVQRVYDQAYLNETSSNSIQPSNYSSLVKAAAFAASNCRNTPSKRDSFVADLRRAGVRVDGLGQCMRNENPDGITLGKSSNPYLQLHRKRMTIARYMFYLAFENTLVPGYVTEKPFDALIAGTVPVYLGDAEHLRHLLPRPNAAIFLSDFGYNMTLVARYLTYLMGNETAYEEHRAWRQSFSYSDHIKNKPLLQRRWTCRVCDWAVNTMNERKRAAAAVVPVVTASAVTTAAPVVGQLNSNNDTPIISETMNGGLNRTYASTVILTTTTATAATRSSNATTELGDVVVVQSLRQVGTSTTNSSKNSSSSNSNSSSSINSIISNSSSRINPLASWRTARCPTGAINATVLQNRPIRGVTGGQETFVFDEGERRFYLT